MRISEIDGGVSETKGVIGGKFKGEIDGEIGEEIRLQGMSREDGGGA